MSPLTWILGSWALEFVKYVNIETKHLKRLCTVLTNLSPSVQKQRQLGFHAAFCLLLTFKIRLKEGACEDTEETS